MAEAKLVAVHPVLPAHDVSASLAFYSKLGFTKVFVDAEPPSYAGITRDGLIVHLSKAENAKAIAEQTMLRFGVRGIDALYEELKVSGALHPNGSLSTKPWGTREFTILDLDGVCVTFFELTT